MAFPSRSAARGPGPRGGGGVFPGGPWPPGKTKAGAGPFRVPPLRLSKKWLAPLFRGVHSSLAPTARPGSYARKPLLRKAFCGFDAHPPGGLLLSLRDNSPCVAKSDYSLWGLRPPNPRGFFDKLPGPRPCFVCALRTRRPPGGSGPRFLPLGNPTPPGPPYGWSPPPKRPPPGDRGSQ